MASNPYEQGTFGKIETERLLLQDVILAPVSLDAIGPVGPGAIVLDIGAGGSITLAKKIEELGATYVGVDISDASIASMRKNDISAIRASATQLPSIIGKIDVVHTRATSAWLPESERRKMYEELLRVGDKVVIINFDWTNCIATGKHGSSIISGLEHALTMGGFDTKYGSKQHEEISSALIEDSSYKIETSVIEEYSSTEISADYVRFTVEATIEQLRRSGNNGASTLADLLQVELGYLEDELGKSSFSLPSIHITIVSKI